ncbi:hypothetical protein [Saccharothrix sp. NRRL B-16314]|uniref:hypothetical protein n=1 Tax=Saccharothrix sp. NRRL B-16314 TaxID=1463825 RepID=UPI0012DCE951|nr:hypothetical protein [Saccharothrix sp. NRRL B-16314]
MNSTLMCFKTPGYLMSGVDLASGAARVAGEKSARDRHALGWGVERVQLIQVPTPHASTYVPTQIVAPSARERST